MGIPRTSKAISRGLAGFTLAELLLALLILGVIATFTIPKVLTAQHDSQKKAVFRETISALYQVYYQGILENAFSGMSVAPAPSSVIVQTWLNSKINAIKICPTDADGEGCFTQPYDGGPLVDDQGGFLLASKANIVHGGSLCYGACQTAGGISILMIDYNGAADPNLMGEDQLVVVFVLYDMPVDGSLGELSGRKAGTAVTMDAESQQLWNEIFSN